MLIHFILEIWKVVCLEIGPGLAVSSNTLNCSSWRIRLNKHKSNLLISQAILLHGRKVNIVFILSRVRPYIYLELCLFLTTSFAVPNCKHFLLKRHMRSLTFAPFFQVRKTFSVVCEGGVANSNLQGFRSCWYRLSRYDTGLAQNDNISIFIKTMRDITLTNSETYLKGLLFPVN